jgi:hypothetical protein
MLVNDEIQSPIIMGGLEREVMGVVKKHRTPQTGTMANFTMEIFDLVYWNLLTFSVPPIHSVHIICWLMTIYSVP